ncbi:hypothetical protein ABXV22_22870 [Vibrio rotiferianus]|uniref:hypothetical protein n=1 Tax=Vibrio rotiferianus TaxID=190895 RepID=UPI0033994C22
MIILNFLKKISLGEVIAFVALIISILTYLDSKKAQEMANEALLAAKPNVVIDTSFEAADASRVTGDGIGSLVWYVRYSFINNGGTSTSLRGMLNSSSLPLIMAMNEGKVTTENVSLGIYVGEDLEWRDVKSSDEFFVNRSPESWESLGDMNLELPAGQSKSLAFVYVLDNGNNPVEKYWVNYQFSFSNGTIIPKGHFIKITE